MATGRKVTGQVLSPFVFLAAALCCGGCLGPGRLLLDYRLSGCDVESPCGHLALCFVSVAYRLPQHFLGLVRGTTRGAGSQQRLVQNPATQKKSSAKSAFGPQCRITARSFCTTLRGGRTPATSLFSRVYACKEGKKSFAMQSCIARHGRCACPRWWYARVLKRSSVRSFGI